jgi:hypothetical protein
LTPEGRLVHIEERAVRSNVPMIADIDLAISLVRSLAVHTYDFVRSHMTLDGHTPAQEAAIPIELGTNRWLDLIRQAARNRRPMT